jgi:hypothetical protein
MAKKIRTPEAPGWKPADYTPFYLLDFPTHTEKEIRAEYTRLRDIVQKRAKRLEAAGLEGPAEFLRTTMPKLADVKSRVAAANEQIAKSNEWRAARGKRLLQEMTVKSFISNAVAAGHAALTNEALSLTGIEQIRKRVMDETGEEIELKDVLKFNDFMKSWRTSAYSALVAASDAKAMYQEDYQEVGGTFTDFYELALALGQ